MAGICFHYDEKNRAEWDDIARAYSVDCYELNTPEEAHSGSFYLVDSIERIPNPIVVVQPVDAPLFSGRESLSSFVHPDDAVYVFGSDDFHNDYLSADFSVYIPTPKKAPMWATQAASIVLYDRYTKWLTR